MNVTVGLMKTLEVWVFVSLGMLETFNFNCLYLFLTTVYFISMQEENVQLELF